MNKTTNAKRPNVTADEFVAIKNLTNIDGLSTNMICQVSKRSSFTVYQIRNASDYATYKNNIRQHVANRRPVVPPPTPDKTETGVDMTAEMVQLLQNTNEVLRSLDARLQWVEEHAIVKSRNIFGR